MAAGGPTATPQVDFKEGLARWSQPILDAVLPVVPRPANPEDGSLEAMAWYQLETGGKRLRPLIAVLATEALGGDPEAALSAAAGVELLHNATLVHDDFQDGDIMRRGRPTVWKKHGWEQSINAGDGLYFMGLSLLARSPIPGDRLGLLMGRVAERMTQVVRGQVDEFRLKARERPTEAEYLEVIRGQTAGLFSLPLEAACLIAPNVSQEERDAIARAGEVLGLLFQIQDDLLDLVGEKGRERVGTDIAEGKPSLPVVRAMNGSDHKAAARVQALLRLPRTDTEDTHIAEAIALLESTGALASSFDTVRTLAAEVRATGGRLGGLLDELVTVVLAPIAHRLTP